MKVCTKKQEAYLLRKGKKTSAIPLNFFFCDFPLKKLAPITMYIYYIDPQKSSTGLLWYSVIEYHEKRTVACANVWTMFLRKGWANTLTWGLWMSILSRAQFRSPATITGLEHSSFCRPKAHLSCTLQSYISRDKLRSWSTSHGVEQHRIRIKSTVQLLNWHKK